MKPIFLVAIIGVIGVSLIAGIVGYNFIVQQLQEYKHNQREAALSNYTLRDEYDKKFDAYAKELTENCNPNMVSSNSLNASEKAVMQKCADDAWYNNGLADPKFKTYRETE